MGSDRKSSRTFVCCVGCPGNRWKWRATGFRVQLAVAGKRRRSYAADRLQPEGGTGFGLAHRSSFDTRASFWRSRSTVSRRTYVSASQTTKPPSEPGPHDLALQVAAIQEDFGPGAFVAVNVPHPNRDGLSEREVAGKLLRTGAERLPRLRAVDLPKRIRSSTPSCMTRMPRIVSPSAMPTDLAPARHLQSC
jgi:hypothetical protein